MLYINGKQANRLQNCMYSFYFQCKRLRETIDQYEFLCNSSDEDLCSIMDKYTELFFVSIDSMRYRIIIGLGNIIDNNKKSLTFKKIIGLAEQEGIDKINLIIKKTKKDILDYEEFINNIKLLRDKMYAHIDIIYSLEEKEIFDIDFDFLNEQINKAKSFIKYAMETCVDISNAYDGDSIHLSVNWIFDKQRYDTRKN